MKRLTPEARRKRIADARNAAKKAGTSSYTISDARNASRRGIGTVSRTHHGKTCAKEILFEYWLANPRDVTHDVVSYVKKKRLRLISSRTNKPIPDSILRSWVNSWKRGPEDGAFYPHSACGREGEIENALAMLRGSVYDELVDLLAKSADAEELLSFQLSSDKQRRLDQLLSKDQDGTLSTQESAELDAFEQLEHVVRLLKARVRERASRRIPRPIKRGASN